QPPPSSSTARATTTPCRPRSPPGATTSRVAATGGSTSTPATPSRRPDRHIADGFTASLSATNSSFSGNLARHGRGGAIQNSNTGSGSATVDLYSTYVGPVPRTLNTNEANYGGGIYN